MKINLYEVKSRTVKKSNAFFSTTVQDLVRTGIPAQFKSKWVLFSPAQFGFKMTRARSLIGAYMHIDDFNDVKANSDKYTKHDFYSMIRHSRGTPVYDADDLTYSSVPDSFNEKFLTVPRPVISRFRTLKYLDNKDKELGFVPICDSIKVVDTRGKQFPSAVYDMVRESIDLDHVGFILDFYTTKKLPSIKDCGTCELEKTIDDITVYKANYEFTKLSQVNKFLMSIGKKPIDRSELSREPKFKDIITGIPIIMPTAKDSHVVSILGIIDGLVEINQATRSMSQTIEFDKDGHIVGIS